MKIVEQSLHIENQSDFSLAGISKFIEKCTRVSYQSLDKITDISYKKFVDNLIKNRHFRGLEFGTIHIKMYMKDFFVLRDVLVSNRVWNDWWFKYKYVGDVVFITTNFRYYYCTLLCYDNLFKSHGIELNALVDITPNKNYPVRYTVFFDNIERGVMDEFRTHIGLSHLAESTRWCNYSKDKFDNEITFIIPTWVNTKCPNKEQEGPSSCDLEWSNTLLNAEASYMNLLKKGWTPQQARTVLPLGIKSTLVSCGFKDAWTNFINQRKAADAHPLARELAIELNKKLNIK